MSLTFEIIDGDALAIRLEATGKAARRVARKALKSGGEPMLEAIRGYIHDDTGALRRGLKLRPGKNDRAGRFSMLIQSWTTREAFARTRSSGVARKVRDAGGAKDRYRNYYSVPLEYGHSNARGGGHTEAHPFLRPGFDATEDSTAELIEAALADAITDAF